MGAIKEGVKAIRLFLRNLTRNEFIVQIIKKKGGMVTPDPHLPTIGIDFNF